MKRCEICGSRFHKTQPYPNWGREYVLTYLSIMIPVILGAIAVLAWISAH